MNAEDDEAKVDAWFVGVQSGPQFRTAFGGCFRMGESPENIGLMDKQKNTFIIVNFETTSCILFLHWTKIRTKNNPFFKGTPERTAFLIKTNLENSAQNQNLILKLVFSWTFYVV